MCTTLHFSTILELIHKCMGKNGNKKSENKWLNVKTIQVWSDSFCHRKNRLGQPVLCCILWGLFFYFIFIFIINTIKSRLLFWFFLPLSEYTRTLIIKCSLSAILQRTRHKSQETMGNVNKAERIEFLNFFIFYFF